LNERTLQAAKRGSERRIVSAIRADVSNLTDLDTMFATIKREFGHLDGVFVNAGMVAFLPFEEMTEQDFDRVIAVISKGGLLHDSKSLAATPEKLVCNHQCVRRRVEGMADNLGRLDL